VRRKNPPKVARRPLLHFREDSREGRACGHRSEVDPNAPVSSSVHATCRSIAPFARQRVSADPHRAPDTGAFRERANAIGASRLCYANVT